MYESHARPGFELSPETKSLLAELFAGRTCCRCSEPAERMARDQFYCPAHYERNQRRAEGPRVYRCAVAAEG